jgi:hypothetical protein
MPDGGGKSVTKGFIILEEMIKLHISLIKDGSVIILEIINLKS